MLTLKGMLHGLEEAEKQSLTYLILQPYAFAGWPILQGKIELAGKVNINLDAFRARKKKKCEMCHFLRAIS